MAREVVLQQERHMKPSVLVLDDEPALRRLCERTLSDIADVASVDTVEAARALLENRRFDVLLLDLQVRGGSGLAFLEEMVARGSARVVAFTASPERLPPGCTVDGTVSKPFQIDELRRAVLGGG
jgi:DNA-binding NtrC family response regulator